MDARGFHEYVFDGLQPDFQWPSIKFKRNYYPQGITSRGFSDDIFHQSFGMFEPLKRYVYVDKINKSRVKYVILRVLMVNQKKRTKMVYIIGFKQRLIRAMGIGPTCDTFWAYILFFQRRGTTHIFSSLVLSVTGTGAKWWLAYWQAQEINDFLFRF